ncbi:MAG: hypothetical protein ACXADW_16630 [Candidatus Hodarchaeales archaeon]|jgi:hypothetical protein
MTKQQLLKKVHKLIWRGCGDIMSQDTLEELQELVDKEIIKEAELGSLRIKQLSNGYIKSIVIPKGEVI